MALESAWRCQIPAARRWLRALMLERERVANHLGDLGALGNDAALSFGLAQFSRLSEDWLRLSQRGLRAPPDDGRHRARRRRDRPAAADARPPARALRRDRAGGARAEAHLRRACRRAGPLPDHRPRDAAAGRAARTDRPGRARQRRRRPTCAATTPGRPTTSWTSTMATHRHGDVAARVAVRFDEMFESLRLIRAICARLARRRDARRHRAPPAAPRSAQAGSKAGAARCWSRWSSPATAASCAAIATIPHGRPGR